MSRRRSVLGEQALHLVRETAKTAEEIDRVARRNALRRKVDKASERPTPGTSDLLGRPMQVGTIGGIGADGKLRAVDTYDLVGMAPIHLKPKGDQ